ncbi:MAG: electron transfer flavoprotein subunit beta/FixA family protein, partial [Bacilli bacterium]|nr:electron transfer flavoprotein subunit beta/FixA family protein [Bacilli bacterium]
MNITVLVKPVPYKSIVDQDGNVVRNKIKNIINKDDKCAIEEALKIKEKTNGKVSSISMSVKSNIKVLKDILAYGVDDAILLNDNIFAGSDTNATAYILSQAINKIKSDLIICGKISSDSATSQVGIGVAAKLNIPFLYNVCEIIEINKEIIKCKIINGNSYEIIKSKLPCLVIVNDSINIPRIPTVNNRLMAEKKEIIIWDSNDIGVDKSKCGFAGSVTNVVGLTPLSTYKDVNILNGTIEDKISKLVEITK